MTYPAVAPRAVSLYWRMRFIGILVSILFVISCATSPLGRSQLRFYSDRDMKAMGEAAFNQMRTQVATTNSVQESAYVDCVARAITQTLGTGEMDWEIVVFNDPQVNAFALPGGKIGVYSGLLEVAENQSQLAAVIGHEIAHVQADHANERVSTSTLAQVGMQVVSTISGSPGPQRDRALAALGLGVQVGVLLPFSRTQEQEADLIGLDLMARAGFDPRESVTLWQNMARSAGKAPPEFLSTHPSSSTRIQDLRGRMPVALSLYNEAVANNRRPNCRR